MYDLDKTLFVSDLDGTLLGPDGSLSDYTVSALARMIGAGLKFTYATARSRQTAHQTAGRLTELLGRMPVILHNGTFIADIGTGEIHTASFLAPIGEIAAVLDEYGIAPIVYSLQEDRQYFTYLPEKLSPEACAFNETRRGDPRDHPITDPARLWDGDVFYISCIDTRERLLPAYERLKDLCGCLFGKDYYSGSTWLELHSPEATKASAILRLKQRLGCERVIVFGDGHNDISMFRAADECYAVADADKELKAIASGIIGSNDRDGVVRWLEEKTGL